MKNPPHPGRIVREECLEPLGLSVTEGARVLGVSRQALNNLVNEKAGILPGEMEIMSATLDERKYRKLLDDTIPVVIHDGAEYRRLLRATEMLMDKPEEEITEEEGRLLEMLGFLVEEYEDRVHPLPATEPHKMLKHLLEEQGARPSDLSSILPKSRVSEILSGKRGISKTQAKQLAKHFHVPVELFL